MNVKFAADGLRCRVTRAEFDRLLAGRAVTLDVPLPRGHAFRASINVSAAPQWLLDSDPTGIWLTIPKAQVQELGAALPSREGIEEEFPTAHGKVRVVFEVDVRDPARRVSSEVHVTP